MPEPSAPRRHHAAIFTLAGATLVHEVALTRAISFSFWYPLVAIVVAMALFGFALAGLWVARHPEPARLLTWAAALPPAFLLPLALLQHLPFEPFDLLHDPAQWLYLPLALTLIALPFFLSGVVTAALLATHPHGVAGIIFADLSGAALGALLSPLLIPTCGVPQTLALSATATAGAALLLGSTLHRTARWAAMLTCALALASLPWADTLLRLQVSHHKSLDALQVQAILDSPDHHRGHRWSNLGRVDLITYPDPSGAAAFALLIDGGAALTHVAAPRAPIDQLGPNLDDEAFFLTSRQAPKVYVAGAGGGREVLTALRNGAAQVVAVEINPAIFAFLDDELRDFTDAILQHPRVEAVVADARAHLRRRHERFDLILCPHTITNAALGASGHDLAESFLLTREGLTDYLQHLGDRGVLFITLPEPYLPRLIATLRAAVEDQHGAFDPHHVAIWRAFSPDGEPAFFAALAWQADPFSSAEAASLLRHLARIPREPLYIPHHPSHQAPAYRDHLAGAPPMLRPASDAWPFLQSKSWSQWRALGQALRDPHTTRDHLDRLPLAELSLAALLLIATAVAAAILCLPHWRRAQRPHRPWRTSLAAAALGAAFMFMEFGLIHRLTLSLGHPTLAFSFILGVLLFSSGLGAYFAGRLAPQRLGRACWAAATLLALFALGAPTLVAWTHPWALSGRLAVVAAVCCPIGFATGIPFTLLLRRVGATQPAAIARLWGVNAAFGVWASVATIPVALVSGTFDTLFLVAAALYLLASVEGHRHPGAHFSKGVASP